MASQAHREALTDRRSAAAKRLKHRLEVRPKMKRGSLKKVKVSATMSAKTNAHVDVSGAKKNAEATAEVTARLGAKDQWQAAVDPTTGSTYYYNPKTGETSWVIPAH